MKKRVFIVHGWDGKPSGAWLPWLKKELEAKGFDRYPKIKTLFTPRLVV